MRFTLSALAALALGGCASETLPEPEASYDTPGAFVAQREITGELTLLRTLDTLTAQNDKILYITLYDVTPASYEEARELSQRHDLPLRLPLTNAIVAIFAKTEFRVVWYRTLTEEELARLK